MDTLEDSPMIGPWSCSTYQFVRYPWSNTWFVETSEKDKDWTIEIYIQYDILAISYHGAASSEMREEKATVLYFVHSYCRRHDKFPLLEFRRT